LRPEETVDFLVAVYPLMAPLRSQCLALLVSALPNLEAAMYLAAVAAAPEQQLVRLEKEEILGTAVAAAEPATTATLPETMEALAA
jgi:hypothetical protein